MKVFFVILLAFIIQKAFCSDSIETIKTLIEKENPSWQEQDKIKDYFNKNNSTTNIELFHEIRKRRQKDCTSEKTRNYTLDQIVLKHFKDEISKDDYSWILSCGEYELKKIILNKKNGNNWLISDVQIINIYNNNNTEQPGIYWSILDSERKK